MSPPNRTFDSPGGTHPSDYPQNHPQLHHQPYRVTPSPSNVSSPAVTVPAPVAAAAIASPAPSAVAAAAVDIAPPPPTTIATPTQPHHPPIATTPLATGSASGSGSGPTSDHHASPQDLTVNNIPVDQLTPEEASRIIHSHRKVRYGTACWPCRQRKVKCDNQDPCENCLRRDHPQLCSYKPNRQAGGAFGSAAASRPVSTPLAGRKRAHSPASTTNSSSLRSKVEETKDENWSRGIATVDDSEQVEVKRYLGQNSISALLREQSSSNDRDDGSDIRSDIRDIFAVDPSAPFPLMSTRHIESLFHDVAAELPSDRDVIKLFRTYKETVHPFWGFVSDLDDMESRLMIFLEERSRNARNSVRTAKPVSSSWLGILFGVLAVASQYDESPLDVRTKDSQKYTQISFHFLRTGNFLIRPTFDTIQAMLIICFVLLNDMKAEASWALLGLACRLAQSLGLHRPSREDGRESIPADPKSREMARRRLWWTCVWHDSLISLSFDRYPITNLPCCAIPICSNFPGGELSYQEAMYHLMEIVSRRLNPDAASNANYERIAETCDAIENLRHRVAPTIWQKERLRTATDRLQHFALRLHTAFVLSVCCRPGLRRTCTRLDPPQKQVLAGKCKLNLVETVRMFLDMHQLSVIPTRSWAFTYHGLSSALLLGILPETRADPEVRGLQGELIEALSATAAKDRVSPAPGTAAANGDGARSAKDIELSGPLWRALAALKSIYHHGAIVGPRIKKESDSGASGSGSRSPLPSITPAGQLVTPMNAGNRASQMGNGAVGVSMGGMGNNAMDPHQDAALTMAEMQHGTSLPEISNAQFIPMDPRVIGVENMANLENVAYHSPLDVYDSIWWDPINPWETGVEGMNFDFFASPVTSGPPGPHGMGPSSVPQNMASPQSHPLAQQHPQQPIPPHAHNHHAMPYQQQQAHMAAAQGVHVTQAAQAAQAAQQFYF